MNLEHHAGGAVSPQPKVSRAFNGVWIPASLWTRKDVTWFQKCLLAEIASFESCFASNAYLADLMGSTESCIANEISKLRKLGLLMTFGFDGRKRTIIVAREAHPNPSGITTGLTQPSLPGEPCVHSTVNIVTSVEKRLDTIKAKESRKRSVSVSEEEKDRLMREVVRVPKNAPNDQELADTLSRFPSIQKIRGSSMFFALKGTKFHTWKKNRWVPILNLIKYLEATDRKLSKLVLNGP